MTSADRGVRRGVLRAFGVVALAVLAFGALQTWSVHRLYQDASALQHLLFARVAPLGEARALLYRIEADLRALRHFPPEDRARILAPLSHEVRQSRRALDAALQEYLVLHPDSALTAGEKRLLEVAREQGAESMRREERRAAEQLRDALPRLDQLTGRIIAGEPTPVGNIEYVADEVGEPLARLAALNRSYAEMAAAEVADVRRRLTLLSLAFVGLMLGAVAGVGVALARSVDRSAAREREAMAVELARREREAEQAARASASKTWFIGHVSHEFRTPLSSIIGFTSFLVSSHRTLPESRRAEYLDIVLRNARHLLHVINDILNLSKVEAGTLEVTLAPLRAAEVASAVITSLRPQAEEKEIRVRLEDHCRHLVMADGGRLRQVLFNLLENALKYASRGTEVVVSLRSDPQRVRTAITDQGPGIAPDDLPKLFKEFSRIQQQGAKIAGAGLGLALSKRLVELMGGEIGVVSAPGEGSTFWIELPAGEEIPDDVGAEVDAPVAVPRPRIGTVAVVDDDPDIRAYAGAILRHAGYPVVADDGEPGLDQRLAAANPALILLDLNLRDRSGFQALVEIRSSPGLARVPVVAFTAAASDDVARRTAQSGFHDYLAKPVEPDALLHAVDSVLAPPPPSPPEPTMEQKGPDDAAPDDAPPDDAPPDDAPPDDAPPDDYLAPLRAKFRSGLPERLRTLTGMLEQGDAAGFAREAHKLKGAAAGYGLQELSEVAAAAEEVLRGEGASLSHPAVAALLARLRDAGAASPG